MSLRVREFIYGMGVGLLLLGGFIMGEGLGRPKDIEAYMGRGGPFSACGIEFQQGHDSYSNGTYSFNYYVKRSTGTPLNQTINLQTKTFRCFCPGGLNAQGYCLSCDGGTVENRTLSSGTSDINIPVSMNGQAPYCGGYQMDAAFVSVNGDSSCNTLKPDGSFNGGVWGIYDATGLNCGPTPTVPVPTPTPTTPVSTPTPTTPVATPTPTTPVSTPTPTTPVLSPTPTTPVSTPTPTTPITGTPTPTLPISTGTPTPTPTSPAGPTATPTPDTRCLDTAPSAVRNLKVSRLSSMSVKLAWEKPETGAVTDNAIRYRLAGRDFEYGVTSTGNVTEYSIGSLQANTDYCFSVYPKNNCAPGPAKEVCTGGGQVLGATTLPPTSSLPLPIDVILATFYTLLSAGLMTKGWLWVKSG